MRRLLRAFISGNSYGMVLLLILVTYGMSVSLGGKWSAPVVLLVQVVTVWFALRTSQARRSVRLTADVVLVAAAAVAIVDVIVRRGGDSSPAIFIVGSALYVIAPFSIVRHLITRKVVDEETMLGAIAAYLLFGLSLAYIYRFLGRFGAVIPLLRPSLVDGAALDHRVDRQSRGDRVLQPTQHEHRDALAAADSVCLPLNGLQRPSGAESPACV